VLRMIRGSQRFLCREVESVDHLRKKMRDRTGIGVLSIMPLQGRGTRSIDPGYHP